MPGIDFNEETLSKRRVRVALHIKWKLELPGSSDLVLSFTKTFLLYPTV
jgi:hypothetical protein